ncbi:hypothetical protein ACSBR2_016461 [Camellia fascicularis]
MSISSDIGGTNPKTSERKFAAFPDEFVEYSFEQEALPGEELNSFFLFSAGKIATLLQGIKLSNLDNGCTSLSSLFVLHLKLWKFTSDLTMYSSKHSIASNGHRNSFTEVVA